MPRVSEMQNQRNSHRVPLRVKPTASSENNSLHRAAGKEPNSKLEEKKRGSRMADLETKLDQTMEELKKLKHQLALATEAKTVQNAEEVYEEDEKSKLLSVEKDCNSCLTSDVDEVEDNAMLRAKLAEKMKELETVEEEKERLQLLVEEAMANSFRAEKKSEELEEALKQSKSLAAQLKLNLEAEEAVKATMELEMKRLRIQTDQWRKASEAAASILSSGDKKLVESYDFSANGGLWSPLATGLEVEEGVEGAKKRGGIRVFGELWKKKGMQK